MQIQKDETIYLIKNYAQDLNMSLNYSIMYMMIMFMT